MCVSKLVFALLAWVGSCDYDIPDRECPDHLRGVQMVDAAMLPPLNSSIKFEVVPQFPGAEASEGASPDILCYDTQQEFTYFVGEYEWHGRTQEFREVREPQWTYPLQAMTAAARVAWFAPCHSITEELYAFDFKISLLSDGFELGFPKIYLHLRSGVSSEDYCRDVVDHHYSWMAITDGWLKCIKQPERTEELLRFMQTVDLVSYRPGWGEDDYWTLRGYYRSGKAVYWKFSPLEKYAPTLTAPQACDQYPL